VYFPVSRAGAQPRSSSDIVGGEETILVVDDDPFQREVARELLGSLGYEVALACSGEEALSYVDARRSDLLVLDMVMPPGMDGTETYRQVTERHPGQRAILLSGFAPSDRVREAQELGAGAFLHKPVTRESLAAAVRSELDRAEGDR
jgi:CheY-like chemotaxis protein